MLELVTPKGEPFSAEAIADLFTMLDKDASGAIDYRELQHELRRDANKEGKRCPPCPPPAPSTFLVLFCLTFPDPSRLWRSSPSHSLWVGSLWLLWPLPMAAAYGRHLWLLPPAGEDEQRKKARNLLRPRDIIFVLGISTRAKRVRSAEGDE